LFIISSEFNICIFLITFIEDKYKQIYDVDKCGSYQKEKKREFGGGGGDAVQKECHKRRKK
jgi:hypothetical protein